MGYDIYATSHSGLTVKGGDDKIITFMDSASEKLLEAERKNGRLSASGLQSLESLEKELLAEKDEQKKYQKFCFLMEKLYVPFEFSYGGRKTGLQFWYDAAEYDTWRREDQVKALLEAYAPYAKKGEYLGFVGEDIACWSYVFDGNGSFEEVACSIDWTGKAGSDPLACRDVIVPDVYYEVIVETWGGGEQTQKESRIFRSFEKAEEFLKANTGTLTKTGMEARSIQTKRFEDA